MIDFIKITHPKAGQFLENPETASKRSADPGNADDNVWALLTSTIKDDSRKDTILIKSFYESLDFDISEFNKSLDEDSAEFKLKSIISWAKLNLEQKMYIGLLCYKRGLILQD